MKVEVRERGGMFGLYASKPIREGEIIHFLYGELLDSPTRHSIKVGDKYHIVDPLGYYVNHSCEPTCIVVGNLLVATRDIEPAEEIAFDYRANEDALVNPFTCKCCGKEIK